MSVPRAAADEKSRTSPQPLFGAVPAAGGGARCWYWCEGSHEKAAHLVLALIKWHDLKDGVLVALGAKDKETNNYIVGRVNEVLSELQKCESEQQRQEYRRHPGPRFAPARPPTSPYRRTCSNA